MNKDINKVRWYGLTIHRFTPVFCYNCCHHQHGEKGAPDTCQINKTWDDITGEPIEYFYGPVKEVRETFCKGVYYKDKFIRLK